MSHGIGMFKFAQSQRVSIYELPRLLILHHNPWSIFGDPIWDRVQYRDWNDAFVRLLDGLQNEPDDELTPSNIPNAVMRHLHHIMLADEFEVLNRLDDSIGDIDREMADDNVLRHRLRMWRSFMAGWRPYLYDQYEREETEPDLIEQAKVGLSETQPLNSRWLQQESVRTKFSRAIDHVRSKRKVTLEHCESTFTMLMTTMSLIESGKAIKEAEEVTKLTQLAFFFIPLTFVAGIFGMNLAAFSQRAPSVWSWAVTFVGLSILTYCFLYYRSILIHFQRQSKKRQARRRARSAENADEI